MVEGGGGGGGLGVLLQGWPIWCEFLAQRAFEGFQSEPSLRARGLGGGGGWVGGLLVSACIVSLTNGLTDFPISPVEPH
jgi:hypothetical protein